MGIIVGDQLIVTAGGRAGAQQMPANAIVTEDDLYIALETDEFLILEE
jgi:hypothetical protein